MAGPEVVNALGMVGKLLTTLVWIKKPTELFKLRAS